MKFYDLPDVLIDYIFSFDDNDYYKKTYKNAIKQILHIHHRVVTNMFLSQFHHFYSIYTNASIRYYRSPYSTNRKNLSRSQYILHSVFTHGVQIIHDKVNPTDIRKASSGYKKLLF